MWELPNSKERYDSANPADMLWIMTRYLRSIWNKNYLGLACCLLLKHWFCWKYQYNEYIFNMTDNYSVIPVAVSCCVGWAPVRCLKLTCGNFPIVRRGMTVQIQQICYGLWLAIWDLFGTKITWVWWCGFNFRMSLLTTKLPANSLVIRKMVQKM
jgi:hypothetical protein